MYISRATKRPVTQLRCQGIVYVYMYAAIYLCVHGCPGTSRTPAPGLRGVRRSIVPKWQQPIPSQGGGGAPSCNPIGGGPPEAYPTPFSLPACSTAHPSGRMGLENIYSLYKYVYFCRKVCSALSRPTRFPRNDEFLEARQFACRCATLPSVGDVAIRRC